MDPDYGDNASYLDETNNKDSTYQFFSIPPDDEDDIIEGHNELPHESVEISTKILGQG